MGQQEIHVCYSNKTEWEGPPRLPGCARVLVHLLQSKWRTGRDMLPLLWRSGLCANDISLRSTPGRELLARSVAQAQGVLHPSLTSLGHPSENWWGSLGHPDELNPHPPPNTHTTSTTHHTHSLQAFTNSPPGYIFGWKQATPGTPAAGPPSLP